MTFEWTVSTDCCEKLLLSVMHPEDEIFDKLNKCLFELPEYNQKLYEFFYDWQRNDYHQLKKVDDF